MSIVVIYEGQRKPIKVSSPNTLVQLIVAEAADYFKVDISKASLQHRKSILDPSQPFRFCGLSNNAQVDLVVSKNSSSGKLKQCRIALAIEGAENVTETFDSHLTLLEVLLELANRGKLPGDIQFRSPELVYLRAKYEGQDALSSTTLSSLGLAGQSARLQLRFGATVSPQDLQSFTSPAIITSSTPRLEPTQEPAPANPPPIATASAISQSSATEPNSADTAMLVDEPSQPTQPQPSPSIPVPPNSDAPPAAPSMVPSSPVRHGIPSPAACLQLLLTENFDAVSGPAVLTLSKYIFNVLFYPEDERFWRINTENKTFAGKVFPAKGAFKFLHSVGFMSHDTTTLALSLQASAVVTSQDNLSPADQTRLFVQDLLASNETRFIQLGDGWSALQSALQELAIKTEDWPSGGSLPLSNLIQQREKRLSVQAQVQRQQLAAFDPFKSHIVRAAPQPVRQKDEGVLSTEGGSSSKSESVLKLSSTEAQLLELRRKRELLLGRPEEVERLTEVVFPKPEGSSSASTDSAMDIVAEGNDDKSMPKSVLQKILKRSSQEDDAPLTTQAVRDLQKAQKERVYARTLIRIKFPDRVCLQGYFHPRHTAADVYAWVTDCLTQPTSTPFELYISPPRTVLPSSCSDSCGATEASTLSDLKLVPAAMVHLSWKSAAPTGSGADSVGWYLHSDLLVNSNAGGKESSYSAEQLTSAYPTGRSLVPTAAATQRGDTLLNNAQSKSAYAGTSDETVKKSFKPKWLKF